MSRPLAAILIEGTKIVVKAFAEAYKHSIRQRNIKPSKDGKPVQQQVMTLAEASKILNLDLEEKNQKVVEERMLDLIERNIKGDSLYIQSRIYWAYHQYKNSYNLKDYTGDEVLKKLQKNTENKIE
eukprot:NODE_51_length_27121_cov_0.309452.p17 type:complete len:126 gc:universal NODE_51_length_27121_cov_0.309452:26227-26604(+)